MSNNIKILILLGLILLAIAIFNLTILYKPDTKQHIKNELNLDISSCTIIKEENTHGGFHGDGEYFAKANCKDNNKILKQLSKWKSFPLPKVLNQIVYGDEKTTNSLAKEKEIPKINNGLYYFVDRHSGWPIPTDGSNIFDRYSFNYTFAIYDKDTKKLYYYELDT